MRSALSACALALAFLHGADAMGAWDRKLALMADMGLLPDDKPLDYVSQIKIHSNAAAFSADNETIVAETVELLLDNFGNDSDAGTFKNRFWVREGAYKPGAPVFLYDAGEANAEPNAVFRLQNQTSFFKQLVDKYNGLGIVWEHRYYGESIPETIDVNTPPEVFKWLNTEQSLADVDRFAKQFKRENIDYDLTPSNTPWIFVGGSYPAMRAAFMREKYPDTIFASWASSAPVESKIDMSVYFEPVWRGMNHYGWGNCTQDIKAAVRHMDKVMENPTASYKLKEQFLGLGAGNNSNAVFADALTTIFNYWQSYGVEGGPLGLRSFCNWIEKDPATNMTAPAEGWAASKGANFTVGRWASYAPFVTGVNNFLTTNCSGSTTVQGDCNLDLQFTDPDSISWTWQYCTQWGFFQTINYGDHQLVSKYNSLEHQKDICHRQWPTAKEPLFPDWPRVNHTNQVFGGWNIRPSQVYWSGGEFDPWRTLSPLSAEDFAPHPHTFQTPPACGQGQNVSDIFGFVMKDAEHCFDFRTTVGVLSPDAPTSQQYFRTALDSWLKCFKPKGGYGRYRRRY